MSDDRALRDELEAAQATEKRLHAAIDEARRRRETEQRTFEERSSEAASRKAELVAKMNALQQQRSEQRAAEAELDRELAALRARPTSREHADTFSAIERALAPEPRFDEVMRQPVPEYARNQGWLERLIAKLLSAFGKEWQ